MIFGGRESNNFLSAAVCTPAFSAVEAGKVIGFCSTVPSSITVLVAAMPIEVSFGVTSPRAKLTVVILSNSTLSLAVIVPALVSDA